eukprot:TRINITY_DN245_c0_g2_i2.p1 TRINITY_DN245_c0_g2~~TRINITY_DN245_c0_g2_i2.p1  ORF type:complete len:433 (+),score=130.52 TRINITY_DN245_c0_g2_i2:75-1373(+)
MTRGTAFGVLLLVAAGVSAGDICAAHTSCSTCAGVDGCGWCSEPVVYADGTTGPQCAGPSTSPQPFQCHGLYSTEDCLQGWACDRASGTCRQALPGQGLPRDQCDMICTAGPVEAVYACQNGTRTCVEVPPGTAGAQSRDQCNAHCWTPAAPVYKCNAGTRKCEKVPAGTAGSSSQGVCEAKGCGDGDYKCNPNTLQCEESAAGKQAKEQCDGICRAQEDPCEPYTTCSSCLAAGPECGWCSTNVVYANGREGGRCAGVRADILDFACVGTYSNTACAPTPAPTPAPGPAPAPTPSPSPSPLPPRVNCPKGSTVMLQYNCKDQSCEDCAYVNGEPRECEEPYCTLYCSGQCQPVPAFSTSFMWTCNGASGKPTNATLVHYTAMTDCTGPTNPAGSYGGGTFPLDTCDGIGPNVPPQYNSFRCLPCGEACNWH